MKKIIAFQNGVESYYEQALLCYTEERLIEAKQLIQRALDMMPTHIKSLQLYGRISIDQIFLNEGTAFLTIALKHALAQGERSSLFELLYELVNALCLHKDEQFIVGYLKRELNLSMEHVRLFSDLFVGNYIEALNTRYQLQDHCNLAQILNELDMNFIGTLYRMGVTFLEGRDYKVAEALLLLCADLEPYTWVYVEKAIESLIRNRHYEEAENRLSQLAKNDVLTPWICDRLAEIYRLTGQDDLAKECHDIGKQLRQGDKRNLM